MNEILLNSNTKTSACDTSVCIKHKYGLTASYELIAGLISVLQYYFAV